LTLFINEDFEELSCILIHELCHVLQVYPDNSELTKKLLAHVNKVFPQNSADVNIELVTILLARGAIGQIFGKEKLDEFSKSEKTLSVLDKSWQSIDSQPEILNEENPVEAILKLKV
jgi:hypothetical protein